MFWKNDNSQHNKKNTSSWSITTRLVVLYTVSAAIILSLATGFLYWGLERNIENADRRFLNDKIEVLKSISDQAELGFERLKEEVQWEVEAYQFNRYYARMLAPDGSVLIETPNMSSILPPALFSSIVSEAQSPEGTEWKSVQGENYLLMTAQTPASTSSGSARTVQVALNISSQQQILSDYLRTLLIVLVIAILFSAFAGAVVVRKGMQPLAEITQTVKHISASELQERTHPTRWPAELTTLAGTFDAMLDRLEESFTRLRQFSADLAHELRTPINNLMGETEVALSKTRSVEQYREVLESNLEEYNRLSLLIKNLLFLAEADQSNFHICRERLSAREQIEKIVDFYEVLTSEKQMHINFEGDAEVQADFGLFRRAISNILSNAIQYAPDHSSIEIKITQTNGESLIKVKDEGPGIPREHIPKLFDRFYRVDPSRSTDLGGTGLGLSIVKSIMDLHGGSIDIQSQPGAGTTVILRFPDL